MPDPETVDPQKPEPAPDATLRMPLGAPADPSSTQQLNLSKQLEAGGTVKMPLPSTGSALDQTQRIALSPTDEPPIRLQKVDQPVEAAGQTQKRPTNPETPPRPFGWKLPLLLGVLVVLGAAAYLVFSRGPALQAVVPPPAAATVESTPPGAQVYLEQAKAGDAHAMRMLGVMYYYGLNVPQDREKGLYWYRKAAEKGSDAARSELSKIEGGH